MDVGAWNRDGLLQSLHIYSVDFYKALSVSASRSLRSLHDLPFRTEDCNLNEASVPWVLLGLILSLQPVPCFAWPFAGPGRLSPGVSFPRNPPGSLS